MRADLDRSKENLTFVEISMLRVSNGRQFLPYTDCDDRSRYDSPRISP
jgi:hypothetical protein